jgi:phosphoribosylaminoimidazole-succinocarboxamide synthase
VSKENLARMRELTYKANDVLKKLFDDAGILSRVFLSHRRLPSGENSSPRTTSPLNRPNSSLKSKENLARMRELTYKANDVLKKLFDDAGLILVDFKNRSR